LVNGFTDHLQVATTNGYNTIAGIHTLQITDTHRLMCLLFTASRRELNYELTLSLAYTISSRTTENAFLLLLRACMLRALPSNGPRLLAISCSITLEPRNSTKDSPQSQSQSQNQIATDGQSVSLGVERMLTDIRLLL
jgi:hypothetical protein